MEEAGAFEARRGKELGGEPDATEGVIASIRSVGGNGGWRVSPHLEGTKLMSVFSSRVRGTFGETGMGQ